jgi:hypothetical protein
MQLESFQDLPLATALDLPVIYVVHHSEREFRSSNKERSASTVNDAAKPNRKVGEVAAHVQAISSGKAKGRCG